MFTCWLLAHDWRRDLNYIGYSGTGKQVRDLLHIEDLVDLIDRAARRIPRRWRGVTAQRRAEGRDCSLSLRETTDICRELTGNDIAVAHRRRGEAGDVPIYVSDCRELFERTDWRPSRGPKTSRRTRYDWINRNTSRCFRRRSRRLSRTPSETFRRRSARDEEDLDRARPLEVVDRPILAARESSYEMVAGMTRSGDRTAEEMKGLRRARSAGALHPLAYRKGFGFAVRAGLEAYTGDALRR